jgi:hypothetical protein
MKVETMDLKEALAEIESAINNGYWDGYVDECFKAFEEYKKTYFEKLEKN